MMDLASFKLKISTQETELEPPEWASESQMPANNPAQSLLLSG